MIAVVDTCSDNKVVSRHRTAEAAERANMKLQSAVKANNPQGSYIPTVLVRTDAKIGELLDDAEVRAGRVARDWEED